MSKILGNRIKLFRTKENMTRAELATHLEISIHTLIKYEQGQREPNIETLNKISQILNVSPNTLLADETFDIELLNKAVKLALPILPEYMEDNVLGYLQEYTHDYASLFNLYTKRTNFLPLDSIKGLLKFIFQVSEEEFNDIYKNLISTDIYKLDPELKKYCNNLHLNIANPLKYISNKNQKSMIGVVENPLNRLHECQNKNEKYNHIPTSIKYAYTEVPLTEAYGSLKTLLRYTSLDIELSDEELKNLLNRIIDLIELEVYKIKKSRGIEIK